MSFPPAFAGAGRLRWLGLTQALIHDRIGMEKQGFFAKSRWLNRGRNRASAFRWARLSLSSGPRRIYAQGRLPWCVRLPRTRETSLQQHLLVRATGAPYRRSRRKAALLVPCG